MLGEELVEGLAAPGDGSSHGDRVCLAGERSRARLASFLVPHSAVPVRIVLSILEQRTIGLEPLASRRTAAAAAAGIGTLDWTGADGCGSCVCRLHLNGGLEGRERR